MAVPQYASNHTIDPATGFLENPAFPNQFDAVKKKAFLKVYFNNGLKLRRACEEIGISIDTFNRAYHVDTAFKSAYDVSLAQYMEDLEGVSRVNALNPRSVIERIFQLKCLLPEKYGQENRPSSTNITLSIDGKTLELISKRSEVVEAEQITDTSPSYGDASTTSSTETPHTEPL